MSESFKKKFENTNLNDISSYVNLVNNALDPNIHWVQSGNTTDPEVESFTTGGTGYSTGTGDYEFYKYVPNTDPNIVPWQPWDPNMNPYITTGPITITDGTSTGIKPATGSELIGMLIEGKDLIEDKEEFLEVIRRLPNVNGDNLKTIEVYERLRRFAEVMGLVETKKETDKDAKHDK